MVATISNLFLMPSPQDMNEAISIIDRKFSTTAVECQPAKGMGAATLLGSFGEFFREMEFGRESAEEQLALTKRRGSEGSGSAFDVYQPSPNLQQAINTLHLRRNNFATSLGQIKMTYWSRMLS